MESELNIASAVALRRRKFMRSYPSQLQAIYLSIKRKIFFLLKIFLAFATYLLFSYDCWGGWASVTSVKWEYLLKNFNLSWVTAIPEKKHQTSFTNNPHKKFLFLFFSGTEHFFVWFMEILMKADFHFHLYNYRLYLLRYYYSLFFDYVLCAYLI